MIHQPHNLQRDQLITWQWLGLGLWFVPQGLSPMNMNGCKRPAVLKRDIARPVYAHTIHLY